MKTYCKHLVVSDVEKILHVIIDYMKGKIRKNSTVSFYAHYMGQSKNYVRENLKPGTAFWETANRRVAADMAKHIHDRTVREHLYSTMFGMPLIRYQKIIDGGNGKERELGLESVMFRLYEAVAADAADPLFKAKIGTFQCASIKGRGQNYGKKAVKKWISQDVNGTKYHVQSDIRQCYPSIPHDKLESFLRRDLRKSHELLYLFLTFLEMYREWPSPSAIDERKGILIGSPASKDICNYYLSYAYHYACNELVKISVRRGIVKIKRLISHVIFYADDIVLYGSSKGDLKKALDMLIDFMNEKLGVKIKESWRKTKTQYIDKSGQIHGNLLDYMGFRFHCGEVKSRDYYGREVRYRKAWTSIRKGIFLRARRKFADFIRKLRHRERVSIRSVRSVISRFGWFKNTDMAGYRKRNKLDKLLKIARRIVSDYEKGKLYNADKYFNMWRCMYA